MSKIFSVVAKFPLVHRLCMSRPPTVRTLSIRLQNYTVVEGQTVNITLELDSDVFDDEFNVTLVHMDGSAVGEVSCSTGFFLH